MTRVALPDRRRSSVFLMSYADRDYRVCVGFYSDGAVGEVFIDGPKEGSEIDVLLDDAAILASLALQHGVPAETLAKSMSRLPDDAFGRAKNAASVLGVAMDLVARITTQRRAIQGSI